MDKQRRANIQKTIDKLNQYKIGLEPIAKEIKSLLEIEEAHRDSISLKPIYEKRIEEAECSCDYISAAGEYLEEVSSSFDDVINALEQAMK